MEIELRDYVATPGHLDDWIRGWSEGVMPIRARCGFHLIGGFRGLWVRVHGAHTGPTGLTWCFALTGTVDTAVGGACGHPLVTGLPRD
jgi:hypothetical protein